MAPPVPPLSWWQTPLPSRPVSTWRTLGVVGAAFLLAALLLASKPVAQARMAGVGLGVVIASLSIARPAALWDHGRMRVWRDLLGDRAMWLLYLVLGAAIIAGAAFLPATA